MRMQIYRLENKNQTVEEIRRIAESYAGDLERFIVRCNDRYLKISELNKDQFFDFVKKIRYVKDISPVELVIRPAIILQNIGMGADCKKKTIICCCYFTKNNIKYRLIGSSKRSDRKIHHIFPQILENGKWQNFDATYNHYKLAEPKEVTNAEIL